MTENVAQAKSCGGCSDGLVEVNACTCGAGPACGIPGVGHEPLCGAEPCPEGCWDRLHPPVLDLAQRAAEAGLAVIDPADVEAVLTAKGPLPDALYDRLRAVAGMAS